MTPDPHHPDSTHLQDLYYAENANYSGRFTTPTLYDIKAARIVNNESSDILRMMNSVFDGPLNQSIEQHNYLPESREAEIEAANEWIYESINNGVYRAGFAE